MLRIADDVKRSGDGRGAIILYRGAAQEAPSDPLPLQRLGTALLDANEAERAEQAFRSALTLRADDPPARRGLALSLLAQGRAAEALPILQTLEASGSDARLLRAEGTAFDMLGRSAEAQAAFRRGIARAPSDADLHGNLALSLALSGNAADALAELRAALAAPQPDPRQEGNAVLVLSLLGRTAEAEVRGTQTLGTEATISLMRRAARARAAETSADRLAALGVLTSSLTAAPPATSSLLPPPETTSVTGAAPANSEAPSPPVVDLPEAAKSAQ
jgi:Flp pilus assembly protein TadD